jgi:hypothetical protein
VDLYRRRVLQGEDGQDDSEEQSRNEVYLSHRVPLPARIVPGIGSRKTVAEKFATVRTAPRVPRARVVG